MTEQLVQRTVLVGCEVTAQGTPDMTVALSAGAVLFDNAPVTVAADTSISITAADADLDRYDIITVDSAGASAVQDGTPGVEGPDVDMTSLLGLAIIKVAAGVTEITTDDITDVRDFAIVHISPYRVSGLWYGPEGTLTSLAGWTNNDMFLVPFFTGKDFAIQKIGVSLLSAGTAGSKGRLGIYRDDGNGALTLLVDAGQVALDTGSGEMSASTSQTLAPGWWWFACAFQSLGASTPGLTALVSTGYGPVGRSSLPTGAPVTAAGGMKQAGVSGGLPTNPSSLVYAVQSPQIWVQAT